MVTGGIDTRHEFAGLFSVYEWLMIAVTVIVYSAVVYALVRYRRRDGGFARGKAERKKTESAYAFGLALIAVGLVYATFHTEAKVDRVSKSAALQVAITAFQWGWRFDYPQSGRSVIGDDEQLPTLVVPVGVTVRFTATSRDVIHSFWIPAERFKRDAFPHRTTTFDLLFDHAGTTMGRCAEFCGLRHANMAFVVRAVPRALFDAELARVAT